MRFAPLLPSHADPLPWRELPAVELAWTGSLHSGWSPACPPVHALHLSPTPWTEALGTLAAKALRCGLDPDFLVIPAALPSGRMDRATFLGVLEGLLEWTQGAGIKVALRPAPGAAPALVRQLREVRGEAVGFCWDPQVGEDLPWISDRLFCAVGAEGADLEPLRRLGYRWNVALPGEDPRSFLALREKLDRAYPDVLFPLDLPEARPGEEVRFGRSLEEKP